MDPTTIITIVTFTLGALLKAPSIIGGLVNMTRSRKELDELDAHAEHCLAHLREVMSEIKRLYGRTAGKPRLHQRQGIPDELYMETKRLIDYCKNTVKRMREYEKSYSNSWRVKFLHILAMATTSRTDLFRRRLEECVLWLDIAGSINFLRANYDAAVEDVDGILGTCQHLASRLRKDIERAEIYSKKHPRRMEKHLEKNVNLSVFRRYWTIADDELYSRPQSPLSSDPSLYGRSPAPEPLRAPRKVGCLYLCSTADESSSEHSVHEDAAVHRTRPLDRCARENAGRKRSSASIRADAARRPLNQDDHARRPINVEPKPRPAPATEALPRKASAPGVRPSGFPMHQADYYPRAGSGPRHGTTCETGHAPSQYHSNGGPDRRGPHRQEYQYAQEYQQPCSAVPGPLPRRQQHDHQAYSQREVRVPQQYDAVYEDCPHQRPVASAPDSAHQSSNSFPRGSSRDHHDNDTRRSFSRNPSSSKRCSQIDGEDHNYRMHTRTRRSPSTASVSSNEAHGHNRIRDRDGSRPRHPNASSSTTATRSLPSTIIPGRPTIMAQAETHHAHDHHLHQPSHHHQQEQQQQDSYYYTQTTRQRRRSSSSTGRAPGTRSSSMSSRSSGHDSGYASKEASSLSSSSSMEPPPRERRRGRDRRERTMGSCNSKFPPSAADNDTRQRRRLRDMETRRRAGTSRERDGDRCRGYYY